MRWGNGIFGMVLWCSGILLIILTCVMDILGEYMDSALLMSSVAIGQFLIWFFSTDSFMVCLDSCTTSSCSILALSAPFISFLRIHDFLISTVLRKVKSVVWSS